MWNCSLGPVEVGSFLFWFAIFFVLVFLIETSEKGENLLEPTRSESRYTRRFARMIGLRSRSAEVRSDAQLDHAAELRTR